MRRIMAAQFQADPATASNNPSEQSLRRKLLALNRSRRFLMADLRNGRPPEGLHKVLPLFATGLVDVGNTPTAQDLPDKNKDGFLATIGAQHGDWSLCDSLHHRIKELELQLRRSEAERQSVAAGQALPAMPTSRSAARLDDRDGVSSPSRSMLVGVLGINPLPAPAPPPLRPRHVLPVGGSRLAAPARSARMVGASTTLRAAAQRHAGKKSAGRAKESAESSPNLPVLFSSHDWVAASAGATAADSIEITKPLPPTDSAAAAPTSTPAAADAEALAANTASAPQPVAPAIRCAAAAAPAASLAPPSGIRTMSSTHIGGEAAAALAIHISNPLATTSCEAKSLRENKMALDSPLAVAMFAPETPATATDAAAAPSLDLSGSWTSMKCLPAMPSADEALKVPPAAASEDPAATEDPGAPAQAAATTQGLAALEPRGASSVEVAATFAAAASAAANGAAAELAENEAEAAPCAARSPLAATSRAAAGLGSNEVAIDAQAAAAIEVAAHTVDPAASPLKTPAAAQALEVPPAAAGEDPVATEDPAAAQAAAAATQGLAALEPRGASSVEVAATFAVAASAAADGAAAELAENEADAALCADRSPLAATSRATAELGSNEVAIGAQAVAAIEVGAHAVDPAASPLKALAAAQELAAPAALELGAASSDREAAPDCSQAATFVAPETPTASNVGISALAAPVEAVLASDSSLLPALNCAARELAANEPALDASSAEAFEMAVDAADPLASPLEAVAAQEKVVAALASDSSPMATTNHSAAELAASEGALDIRPKADTVLRVDAADPVASPREAPAAPPQELAAPSALALRPASLDGVEAAVASDSGKITAIDHAAAELAASEAVLDILSAVDDVLRGNAADPAASPREEPAAPTQELTAPETLEVAASSAPTKCAEAEFGENEAALDSTLAATLVAPETLAASSAMVEAGPSSISSPPNCEAGELAADEAALDTPPAAAIGAAKDAADPADSPRQEAALAQERAAPAPPQPRAAPCDAVSPCPDERAALASDLSNVFCKHAKPATSPAPDFLPDAAPPESLWTSSDDRAAPAAKVTKPLNSQSPTPTNSVALIDATAATQLTAPILVAPSTIAAARPQSATSDLGASDVASEANAMDRAAAAASKALASVRGAAASTTTITEPLMAAVAPQEGSPTVSLACEEGSEPDSRAFVRQIIPPAEMHGSQTASLACLSDHCEAREQKVAVDVVASMVRSNLALPTDHRPSAEMSEAASEDLARDLLPLDHLLARKAAPLLAAKGEDSEGDCYSDFEESFQ